MKLSKSLLSAIVMGIAVQSAVSCTKSSLKSSGINPGGPNQTGLQSEQQKGPSAGRPFQPTSIPEWMRNDCFACGMG